MFKIGEFSRLSQVSVRMLRHYDEQGLLKPAHTDEFTQYRRYSAAQIDDARRIVFFRDLGFKVADIKDMLRDHGSWEARLRERRDQIEREIGQGQERRERIDRLLSGPERITSRNGVPSPHDVRLASVPAMVGVSLRDTVPTYFHEEDLWERMKAALKRAGLSMNTRPPCLAVCHDEGYKERDVDLEVCFFPPDPEAVARSCPELALRVLPGEPFMASLLVCGPYELLAPSYGVFAAWLEEYGEWELTEISREIYHNAPWHEENPDRYLTEIQMPLKKRA